MSSELDRLSLPEFENTVRADNQHEGVQIRHSEAGSMSCQELREYITMVCTGHLEEANFVEIYSDTVGVDLDDPGTREIYRKLDYFVARFHMNKIDPGLHQAVLDYFIDLHESNPHFLPAVMQGKNSRLTYFIDYLAIQYPEISEMITS